MKNQNLKTRFDLTFKNLLVWVDNSPFFKCCKSNTNQKISASLDTSNIRETSTLLTESLVDDKDNNSEEFNEIRESGMDSLHYKISNAKLKNILLSRAQYPKKRLSYGIPILKNISGTIRSDEMVAILGPSGSGKTTLLNFVSSRSNWDKNLFVDGDLYVNNHKVKHLSKYKHLIGFVPQEDLIIEDLSIRENFKHYGRLRGIANYKEKATKIIKDLQLEKCQNTKIGGENKRGVSGGERKRGCIGVELMGDPKVLFLDEPTTGIDAFMALEVIKNLRNLNQEAGLGVVAVIHQPRQEIIDQFDRVCIHNNKKYK
jgi:ABC-type multidrug transport system ATPase subunit